MKVAVVLGQFPTLSEIFILDHITGLIDRGHQVDIFADRPKRTTPVHDEVERYKLLDRTYYREMPHALPARVLKGIGLAAGTLFTNPVVTARSLNVFRHGLLAASFTLLWAAKPLRHKRTYDIIHCHYGPYGLLGAALREIGVLEGKLVTAFHGYDVTSLPHTMGGKMYKRLFKTGDLYVPNSTFLADRAIALGCPKNKVVMLSTGVHLSKFTYAERNLAPGSEVCILTVGRLVEVKGVEYAIRAMPKVRAVFPNVRYKIAGDGPLRIHLQRLARELGVADCVEFLGGQTYDQILDLYAHAHICVLSGVVGRDGAEEGQGGVLTEAQATGLPVVASRVGGIPDTVVDGLSGFLVPPKDVEALADKLISLIQHPEAWAEMGRAGRRHVEQHYDVEKINDRLVRVYEELLNGPRE